MTRIDFVSLFPEMLTASLDHSILGRATRRGQVCFRFSNPRDFCYDRHQKVDDSPFGGEPGMLIRAEPVSQAIKSLDPGDGTAIVLTDPAGFLFNQAVALELSQKEHLIFLCGHYEGIDDRIRQRFVTHSLSIGDYVLTNGEYPAIVMTDAIVRLLPDVLGNSGSLAADSFNGGVLSAPNYTRPEEWEGMTVPPVLKSGNHLLIAKWRRAEALKATKERRPDLFARLELQKSDLDMLSS